MRSHTLSSPLFFYAHLKRENETNLSSGHDVLQADFRGIREIRVNRMVRVSRVMKLLSSQSGRVIGVEWWNGVIRIELWSGGRVFLLSRVIAMVDD